MLLTAITMVARTYCDVWMIKNGTAIESSIIGRDVKAFKHYVLRFISLMLPISLVNSLLRYSLNEMHLRFRTRFVLIFSKSHLCASSKTHQLFVQRIFEWVYVLQNFKLG